MGNQEPTTPDGALEWLANCERRDLAEGEFLIEQEGDREVLFFLIQGAVQVLRDEVEIATVDEPGAVFGEMAVLLGRRHTASVRTTEPSSFRLVERPRAFLEEHPRVCLQVARTLALRLDGLNRYLVDVKNQFPDHDHIGMVDEILETLMHRQPPPRR